MRVRLSIINPIIVVLMLVFLITALDATFRRPELNRVSEHHRRTDEWGPEIIGQMNITLPDGRKILAETVSGGENNHCILFRVNGYTIIMNESRIWCWARQGEDGNLESTGYAIHLYNPEELGLEKDIRMSKEKALENRLMMRTSAD